MCKNLKYLAKFKNKLYINIRNQKSLKFLTIFTKVGYIPSRGKIFELLFCEKKILMYVPKNHLELAEAIFHFKQASIDCEMIVKYFEIHKNIVPTRKFLDVGANQGLYSLALGIHNFETQSVEGTEELANLIRINLLLNGITMRADVKNIWVTPDSQVSYYAHESDFSLTNSLKSFGKNEILNKTTLSELVKEFEPSIVKLDLEGLDSDVILSVKVEDFRNVKYLVIEQNENDSNSKKVSTHLERMGFIKSLATNLLGELVDLNNPGLKNYHYTRA